MGQDEGGVAGRVTPAFYSPFIDFTADHTWWDYDAILWASLAPKFPGKPLLIQETGEQRRLTLDDHLRFSAEVEGWQLERKIAIAFAQGAGALEWVWNVNAYHGQRQRNSDWRGAAGWDGEAGGAGAGRVCGVCGEESAELHEN